MIQKSYFILATNPKKPYTVLYYLFFCMTYLDVFSLLCLLCSSFSTAEITSE